MEQPTIRVCWPDRLMSTAFRNSSVFRSTKRLRSSCTLSGTIRRLNTTSPAISSFLIWACSSSTSMMGMPSTIG